MAAQLVSMNFLANWRSQVAVLECFASIFLRLANKRIQE